MGSHDDKENGSGEKSRSKSKESAKGGLPKTDAQGSSNGNSNVSLDAAGKIAGPSGTKAAVVPGTSNGKQPGPAHGSSNKRAPLARLGGRPIGVDNASNSGLGAIADQMRVQPADQGLVNTMVDMVSRMERSQQAMMDLMLQQAQVKQPGSSGKSEVATVEVKSLDEQDYSTDEEEFDPEAGIEDNVEEDQDVDEDNVLLSSRFAGKKQRFIPEQMQVFVWSQARKVGTDFTADEWRTVNQSALVKSYNSHPEAVMFSAPAADAEVPDLKFKDKKDTEKQMKLVMSACGAAGAAATKVLTQLQDENEKLMDTAKDYRNPDIVIPDSRSEMADILDAVRGKLMNDLAKTLSDSVKINAWMFNQLLLMRRAQYLFKIKEAQNARAIVKKVNPNNHFLFGDRLGQVCKNLKESVQLNPLSDKSGSSWSRGSTFSRGSRGSFRGRRPGFKYGGSFSNDRLGRFAGAKKPKM